MPEGRPLVLSLSMGGRLHTLGHSESWRGFLLLYF